MDENRNLRAEVDQLRRRLDKVESQTRPWTEEQIDDLLRTLSERAKERDDISLPSNGPTRRATIAGILGLGGVAAGGASLASAIGESETYSNSTGTEGTDSQPLSEVNAQDGHFQSLVVDNTAELEQATVNGDLTIAGSVFDDTGTRRAAFSDNQTIIENPAGDDFLTDNPSLDFTRLSVNNSSLLLEDRVGGFTLAEYLAGGSPGELKFTNTRLNFVESVSTSADAMTANPETDAEDGYITVDVNGTAFQIPVYSP